MKQVAAVKEAKFLHWSRFDVAATYPNRRQRVNIKNDY